MVDDINETGRGFVNMIVGKMVTMDKVLGTSLTQGASAVRASEAKGPPGE
jgi:hypothetical protein